jgi:hypothetical protein
VATSPPYDILELRPEGELVTRITGFEEGPIPITPRDGRSSKIVMGVRLFVPREDKQTAPDYWDLTSQTLKPTLLVVAREAVTSSRWVKIHKYGSGPGARFGVELLPAGFSGPPKAETLNQAGP